jgi:hypothetical protein
VGTDAVGLQREKKWQDVLGALAQHQAKIGCRTIWVVSNGGLAIAYVVVL